MASVVVGLALVLIAFSVVAVWTIQEATESAYTVRVALTEAQPIARRPVSLTSGDSCVGLLERSVDVPRADLTGARVAAASERPKYCCTRAATEARAWPGTVSGRTSQASYRVCTVVCVGTTVASIATPNDRAMVLSAVTNELALVRLSVGTAASALSCGGVMTIGTIPRAGTLRRNTWAPLQ